MAAEFSFSKRYSPRTGNNGDPVTSKRGHAISANHHLLVGSLPPSLSHEVVGELNFDLLVSNVERSIMADQPKAHAFNSRELLVKSNPSLFENIPDVTNPRDIYNFLSKTHSRSIDDLTSIRNAVDNTVESKSLPRLSRTTSMRDLRKAAGMALESRKGHHFSSSDLSRIHKKDPSITALFINAPYLSIDDLKHLPEKKIDSVKSVLTLPYLNKEETTLSSVKNNRKRQTAATELNKKDDVSFPVIQYERMDTTLNSANCEDKTTGGKTRKVLEDGILPVAENNRIDKWSSNVFNEKASKTLQDDPDYEINNIQDDTEKCSKYWKSTTTLPLLKQKYTMPQQYSELRVRNSHNDHKSICIDRDQYKLRQKSLLKLKSNNELPKPEKPKLSPRLHSEVSSHSHYSIEKLQKKSSLRDLANSKRSNSNGNGINTIDIEEYAIEAFDLNPSYKFTFARSQSDENIPPPQIHLKRSKTTIDATTRTSQRSLTYSSSSEDRVRSTQTIEPLQRALTILKVDIPPIDEIQERISKRKLNESEGEERRESTFSSDNTGSRRGSKNGNPPTRASNANNSKEQREVLKFKRLEVFGDNGSPIDEYQNAYLREFQMIDKPYVKLDPRRSPYQNTGHRTDRYNPPPALLNRAPKGGDSLPALTFQFNTGEVIVTRSLSVLDQECLDKNRRGCYPRREPLKPSPQHKNNTNGKTFNPIKTSRERSFYGEDSDTTYTLTPDQKYFGDFMVGSRPYVPTTPKSNTERWNAVNNYDEKSMWSHPPEIIEEAEEWTETPEEKVQVNSNMVPPAKKDKNCENLSEKTLSSSRKTSAKSARKENIPVPENTKNSPLSVSSDKKVQEDSNNTTPSSSENTVDMPVSAGSQKRTGEVPENKSLPVSESTENTSSIPFSSGSGKRDMEEESKKREMATSMTSFVERNKLMISTNQHE